MRCPTEDIDIGGHKVTVNTCNFDSKTMKRWDFSEPVPKVAPKTPLKTVKRSKISRE